MLATICVLAVLLSLLALTFVLGLYVFSRAGGVAEQPVAPVAPLDVAEQPVAPVAPLVPRLRVGLGGDVTMDLVLIPAGEFMMGAPLPEGRTHVNTLPHHHVRIAKPFYLGVTEVTQGQWKVLMGTEPWKGKEGAKEGSDYPASYISWEEAAAFCEKLSSTEGRTYGRTYRLPTEAEWEYACRAGTTTLYHFGDDVSRLGNYAWWGGIVGRGNCRDEKYAHRVGQKQPNAWGLYDMHGNVDEWCQDKDRRSATHYRAYRGGSYMSEEEDCESARRRNGQAAKYYHYPTYGFRVATDPTSKKQTSEDVTDLSPQKHDKREASNAAVAAKKEPTTVSLAPSLTEVPEAKPDTIRPHATGSITDVRRPSAYDVWCEVTFAQNVEGVTGWMKIYRPLLAPEGGNREVGKVRVFRTKGNQAIGNCDGFRPRVGDVVELCGEEAAKLGTVLDEHSSPLRWVGRVDYCASNGWCSIRVREGVFPVGSRFRVCRHEADAIPGKFLGVFSLHKIHRNLMEGHITGGMSYSGTNVILEEFPKSPR